MNIRPNSYKVFVSLTKKYCFAAALVIGTQALFACSSDLGRKYSRDPVSAGAFGKLQENTLTSLLQKYVDSDNRVNYRTWLSNSGDLSALKSVLAAIAIADTRSMSAPESKSFYINAYNSMTIDLILSHYDGTMGGASSPIPNDRSIRNIDGLDDSVWDRFKWKVGGQSLSLNDVESKVLRPMGDARIHFAIVCASKGCPPLLNRALSPGSVDSTLDQLADAFVNSGRNTQFNTDRNQIKTSHIIDWYTSDFDRTFGSVKSFFSKFVKVIPADQVQNMSVSYFAYDWTLNEPSPQAAPVTDSNTSEVGAGSALLSETRADVDATGLAVWQE